MDFYGTDNSIYLYTLADAYELNEQYKEALEAIEKAIKLSPNRWEYRYEKQNILGKLKIFDERYSETEQMIKKYKKN